MTFALLSDLKRLDLSLAGFRDVQVLSLSNDAFLCEVLRVQRECKNCFVVGERVAMRDFLGQEFDVVLLYLTEILSLNVLFGVVSTLKSGGQLLVGCPEDVRQLSCFHQTLVTELVDCQRQLNALSAEELTVLIDQRQKVLACPPDVFPDALTKLSEHRQMCILAPRGYGKSTLLGQLINALVNDGIETICRQVYLCAPSRASAHAVFRTLEGGMSVEFVPPERLYDIEDAAVVFIDEAANCAQKFILDNFKRFKRCVLVTTTDGYEGQAQGFVHHMHAQNASMFSLPFCWRNAAEDFLHQWQQRYVARVSSLKKASFLQKVDVPLALSSVTYRVVSSVSEMCEADRQTMIGLLAIAHYRTTPNDLYRLLNADCHYVLAVCQQTIIGVVVWQCERIESDAHGIVYGKRRPSGNLLLQSLLSASAELSLANLSAARMLRIAVNPTYQQLGVGTALLNTVASYLQNRVDFLGASFSAQQENRLFWQKNDYALLNVGLRKSPWLSTHALTVGKALSNDATKGLLNVQAKTWHFLRYYSDDFGELLDWFHVEHATDVDIEALCFSLLSVIEGHRDVIYFLPEISRLANLTIDEMGRDCFHAQLVRCLFSILEHVEQEILAQGSLSRFETLQAKHAKQRVKKLIVDALKGNGLGEWVRSRAEKYCTR